MLPAVRRTYAPKGQTPYLRAPLNYGGLSCISAITEKGQLVTQTIEGSFNGVKVVRFLRHLLRQVKGSVMLIWDGASIHRCEEVKTFLREEAAWRLRLEILPAGAPEFNPDEGVWGWLKGQMANICCFNLKDLKSLLRRKIRALRYRKDIILSFISRSGLMADL